MGGSFWYRSAIVDFDLAFDDDHNDIPIVIYHQQVGVFADGDGACGIVNADRPRGVDGGRLYGLPNRNAKADDVFQFVKGAALALQTAVFVIGNDLDRIAVQVKGLVQFCNVGAVPRIVVIV